MRKYVLPHLPYALMFWFFSKCAEAYRVSTEDEIIHRLMDAVSSLGASLSNPLPSLHPFDLCVGLIGAATMFVVVWVKKRNAKNWRKDIEYGSARWGNRKDIEPYVDPVTENNLILTATENLTLNGRPKNPKYARNKNVLIIGGSGSGKTRFWLKPSAPVRVAI